MTSCANHLSLAHDYLIKLREGNVFTARKRSLGQGNIFIGVCQEFFSRGVPGPGGAQLLWGAWSRGPASGLGCSWGGVSWRPPGWLPLWAVCILLECILVTPVCHSVILGSLCPGGYLFGVSLSRRSLSGRPPYGKERAVRIPLECILLVIVVNLFFSCDET